MRLTETLLCLPVFLSVALLFPLWSLWKIPHCIYKVDVNATKSESTLTFQTWSWLVGVDSALRRDGRHVERRGDLHRRNETLTHSFNLLDGILDCHADDKRREGLRFFCQHGSTWTVNVTGIGGQCVHKEATCRKTYINFGILANWWWSLKGEIGEVARIVLRHLNYFKIEKLWFYFSNFIYYEGNKLMTE